MENQSPIVEVSEGKVAIYTSEQAEIVMWDQAEWEEDPSVTIAIANAIHVAYSQGTAALIETIHPHYIDGLGCPRCFTEDTETVLGNRENTCLACGHVFPLPQELAEEFEEDHPGHDIDILDKDVQNLAFLQHLELCKKCHIPPPKDLSTFIDLSLSQNWTFTEDGRRKYDHNSYMKSFSLGKLMTGPKEVPALEQEKETSLNFTNKHILLKAILEDELTYCFDPTYCDDESWAKEHGDETREHAYLRVVQSLSVMSLEEIRHHYGTNYDHLCLPT